MRGCRAEGMGSAAASFSMKNAAGNPAARSGAYAYFALSIFKTLGAAKAATARQMAASTSTKEL